MKVFYSILFILTSYLFGFSQIGIGTITPNSSSLLDISSTTKGTLLPRMTSAQRNAIVSPAQSLMVYDTDVDLYYYYNQTNNVWTPINVCTVKTISSSGTYTLSENDNGIILDYIGTGTLQINVPYTFPLTLPIGFQVSVTQANTGNIVFAGTGGMSVNNRYNATKTAGQWAKVGIEVKAPLISILSGDVK
jgi:hypothetical protein